MEQQARAPDAAPIGEGCRGNNATSTPAAPLSAAAKGGEPPALRSLNEVGITIPRSRLQKWVGRRWRRKFETQGVYFTITDADKAVLDKAGGVAAHITLYDSSKVNSPIRGRVRYLRKVNRRPNAWQVTIETHREPRVVKRTFQKKGQKKGKWI